MPFARRGDRLLDALGASHEHIRKVRIFNWGELPARWIADKFDGKHFVREPYPQRSSYANVIADGIRDAETARLIADAPETARQRDLLLDELKALRGAFDDGNLPRLEDWDSAAIAIAECEK